MKKLISLILLLFTVVFTGCNSAKEIESNISNEEDRVVVDTIDAEKEVLEPEISESEVLEPKVLDSIYAKLSDEQFLLLTEMMAKSFYSFTLEDEDYAVLESEPEIMECLTALYDYAYENYWLLDHDYFDVYSQKADLISSIPNYDLLNERFILDEIVEVGTNRHINAIYSYDIDPDDMVEYDGVKYVDAKGYLNPGVELFWIEDDTMKRCGEILDVGYNVDIEGDTYDYGVYVSFDDDPLGAYWKDGESFLEFNRDLTGEPAYYVALMDPNRRIDKEDLGF